MNKQEILTNIYNKLRFTGAVKSRKEFAEAIDYNYTCVSAAFNGEERYLSDRFFNRILKNYPQVNPMFAATGEGDVLLDMPSPAVQEQTTYNVDIEKLVEALGEQRAQTERALQQTERALDQIDQLISVIKAIRN